MDDNTNFINTISSYVEKRSNENEIEENENMSKEFNDKNNEITNEEIDYRDWRIKKRFKIISSSFFEYINNNDTSIRKYLAFKNLLIKISQIIR